MDTWEERWEQCWPLLLGHLSARDLICLSFSSRSIMVRLNSTPGWWTQACHTHLWPPSQHSGDSSTAAHSPKAAPLSPAATDQQARQVLLAATGLAHHVRHSRSPPPQTVQIPPWLPGQPGKSRGFSRIEDPGSLDPPLLLTPTQLAWLAFGSLSGHTSGVFISTCSSSPRSHQPCAFMAAVVSNKALLAELYIPRNITPPDPWAGLLTHSPCDSSMSENAGSTCSRRTDTNSYSNGSNRSSHQASSSSSSGTDSIAAASVELWLSSAVQLQPPQQQEQPAAAAGGGRDAGGGRAAARGGRAHRDRGGRRDAPAGDCWHDIHRLIMECIGDNASRCKAVRGTTVIPPGTPAAATIEQQLALLAAAGGPVLDLRRLHWEAAAAAAARERGRQQAAAAAAAWVRPSVRHLMQMQLQEQGPGVHEHSSSLLQQQGHMPQQQQQQQGLGGGHHHYYQQQQHGCGGAASNRCQHHSSSSGRLTAAANGSMSWQAATAARVQSALVDVHMERAAAAEAAAEAAAQGQQTAGGECEVQEGDRPELLAALVEKLPEVAPDVQLLVLPVLLPGGRAAQRIPGAGGSRLSAPKLLCLNVPFLVAVRRHAWEKLPRLRHVLLMVGTPPPLPPAAPPMQCAPWQQQQESQEQLHAGCAIDGGAAAGNGSWEAAAGNGGVVPGTFTLQELEQQWQQQLQLGEGGQQQGQQQGQHLWEAEQDEWFAQQVAQQRPRGGQRQYAMYLEHGYDPEGLQAAGGVGVANEAEALSRAAVDALHDMVHSCMDRSC